MDMKALWQLIQAHQFSAASVAFFSSSIGLSLLARLLAAFPLGWWYATVTAVCTGIAKTGNMRFGAPLWQPFENAFENVLGGTLDAIRAGLKAGDVPPPAPIVSPAAPIVSPTPPNP